MNKNHQILNKTILISLMSALSFTMTFVAIPIGSSKVHLGNAICLLSGLLFGPLIGGLSGSLGMGLNDLIAGYPPQTWIRTFIAKFIMGALVGILFRIFKKKEKINNLHILTSSIFFYVLGITFTLLMIVNSNEITIENKTITLNIFIPILAIVLGTSLLILFMIFRKKQNFINNILVATTYATIANIIIEFTFKIILNTIFVGDFNSATISAITSIPATILTGITSIIIATTLFIPIEKSLKNFDYNKI